MKSESMWKCRLIEAVVVILCAVQVVAENRRTVDPELCIPLFLKIVTYDEDFGNSHYDKLVVYVLYDPAVPASYQQAKMSRDYFDSHAGLRVDGVEVEYREVPIGRVDNLIKKLNNDEYNVLILTNMDKNRIKSITGELPRKSVRTFSFDADYLQSGAAVSVRSSDRGSSVVVNLDLSVEQGSKFSSHLLKMCQVLREDNQE